MLNNHFLFLWSPQTSSFGDWSIESLRNLCVVLSYIVMDMGGSRDNDWDMDMLCSRNNHRNMDMLNRRDNNRDMDMFSSRDNHRDMDIISNNWAKDASNLWSSASLV